MIRTAFLTAIAIVGSPAFADDFSAIHEANQKIGSEVSAYWESVAAAAPDSFLITITAGPDDPTTAALGFIIAATAQKEGHAVTVFLAGDGASLITDEALSTVEGVGTGSLQDHFTSLTAGGARIFISGLSAKAREINEDDLAGKPAEFAIPAKLVELAAAADVVLTY